MEALVGVQVRRLRTERGWSQAQLGQKLSPYGFDLTQTTVAKLELGQRPLRLNEVAAIAHLFGVTVPDLLGQAASAPLVDPMRALDDPDFADLVRERLQLQAQIGELTKEYDGIQMDADVLAHKLHALHARLEERRQRLAQLDSAIAERRLDLLAEAPQPESPNHG